MKKLIIFESDFAQQNVSLDFEGGPKQMGEYMVHSTPNENYGFGNNFSIAAWFKDDQIGHTGGTPTGFDTIFRLTAENSHNSATPQSKLLLQRSSSGSTSPGTRLIFKINEASGSDNKFYRYGGQMRPGYWHHVVMTYDGTNLLGYMNGLFVNASKVVDDPVTIPNVDRTGTFARKETGSQFFDGRIHSVALWDTTLSAAEVLAVHNGGDARRSNLRKDSGAYTSSANLLHWWRLGLNSANLGEDSGKANTLITFVGIGGTGSNDIANDAPQGSAKSTAQIVSVDMDGSTENFINDGPNLMGFGNAFTYNQWVKVNADFVGTDFWMQGIKTDLTSNNRFELSRATTSGAARFTFWDTTGTLIKDFQFEDSVPEVGSWVMMTFTWDGTDLKGYFNSVEDTNPTKNTDNAGTRADQAVQLGVGNASTAGSEVPQNLLTASFHNVALSQAEITEIFATTSGGAFDLSVNSGNYTSSSNLEHWWRFGHNSADIGEDYGNCEVAELINMGDDAVNISPTDIFALAPPSSPVHKQSIEFNGINESMGDSTDQDFGFGVDFSILITFKRRSDTVGLDNASTILAIEGGSNNFNEIIVRSRGDLANDPIEVTLKDEAGANHMVFRYNAPTFFPYDTWHQLMLTWDGDETISSSSTDARLRVWENGGTGTGKKFPATQSTTPTLVAGKDMVNTDRGITIANNSAGSEPFSGHIHSVAIWNRDVGGSAREFNNGGAVTTMDLTKASNAPNLIHWWKLGVDSSDIGKDFGIGTRAPFSGIAQDSKGSGHAEGAEFPSTNLATHIDVITTASGITAADIVSESPS